MLGLGSQSVPCEKHKYDPKSLKMDTALVMLFSDVKKPVNVFGVSSNCHKVQSIYNVNGVNQSAKEIYIVSESSSNEDRQTEYRQTDLDR